MPLLLKPTVLDALIEKATLNNQFYVPLYNFVFNNKKPPCYAFLMKEWMDIKVKTAFQNYLIDSGVMEIEQKRILNNIDKWVNSLNN